MKLTVEKPEVRRVMAITYVRTDFTGREIEITAEEYARAKHSVRDFTGQEKRTVERALVPECGWFDVFNTADGPVSPEDALDAALAGDVELATDFHEAARIVHEFAREALLDVAEEKRYQRVLDACSWAEARRMEHELLSILGYAEGDDLLPVAADKMFLTTAEVARIFRVDELTVRRWSGSKLPASVRVGKKHLFRADAIANVVRSAGPAHAPTAPSTPSKPKPRTKEVAK